MKMIFKNTNDILFRALDRLDDAEYIEKHGESEIMRCNAIANVAKTIVSTTKTQIEIMKLKDKKMDIKPLERMFENANK